MSGEPKTLTPEPATLQGLIVTLGVHGYSLAFQEGRWWAVPPQDAPYEWSDGDTPWEAASKALGVRVVARDEAAELREENKRLSALVDELLLAPNPLDDENMRLRDETAELRAALGATVDAINGALIYHHHSLGNPVKKELNEAVNRAGRALAEGEKP